MPVYIQGVPIKTWSFPRSTSYSTYVLHMHTHNLVVSCGKRWYIILFTRIILMRVLSR